MSVAETVKQIITSWIDGRVLFECELSVEVPALLRLKAALEIGAKQGANLTRANLTRANLTRANLYGANLDGANLTRANLTQANLDGANLTQANLDGANLTRANLTRANLTRANLTRANLDGANLYGANLDGANLYGHQIIDGGLRSDGYRFFLTKIGKEGWRIKAGCRNFSIECATEHWKAARGDTQLGRETFLIIDNMIRLAVTRGWDPTEAPAKVEAQQ